MAHASTPNLNGAPDHVVADQTRHHDLRSVFVDNSATCLVV